MDLVDALIGVLGSANVTSDKAVAQAHAGDWSDAPRHPPAIVLFPRSTEQVSGVLAVLSRFQQPIVVQGGLTGLAGGATPRAGEVALSLSRMNAIESFDTVGGTLTVQAGATLEAVQRRVEEDGWIFPLDLGARGSCQVGGNAATNAGGNRVIRYGTMRELVLGVEVVLADGRVLGMLNRVTKNTTGIDLKQLFVGAEGALGIITRLVLKLAPLPQAASTALCALPSFEAATRLVKALRSQLPALSAFEVMWDDFMQAAVEASGGQAPFERGHPVYVLVETLGADVERDREALERVLEAALDSGMVDDVIVAQSLADSQRLWSVREAVAELLSRLKPHAAFDVGIPVLAMSGFVDAARGELARRFPAQRHLFFGHIGDGNLHLLSGPYADEAEMRAVETVVYTAVREAGGCISAEHGIGVIKKAYLDLSRSEEELSVMRELKQLFDPLLLLNPGRIFDAGKGKP